MKKSGMITQNLPGFLSMCPIWQTYLFNYLVLKNYPASFICELKAG